MHSDKRHLIAVAKDVHSLGGDKLQLVCIHMYMYMYMHWTS